MLRGRPTEFPPIHVQLIPPPAEKPPIASEEPGRWTERMSLVRRHGKLILFVSGLCGLAGLAFALAEPPMYRAHASLEIQTGHENVWILRDADAQASQPTYVESQARILENDDLIERTAAKLRVDSRPCLLSTWRTIGSLAGRGTCPGSHEEIIARLKQNLDVAFSRQSHVLDVDFSSPDAQFSADFLNALGTGLMDEDLEGRWKAAEKTAEWSAAQLKELKSNLDRSIAALLGYVRATGVNFDQEKGRTVAEEKLRQVQEELSHAQADRAGKESRYQVAMAAPAESLPEVLDDATLRDVQVRLTDAKRQLAELSSTFAPTYFKVKTAHAQVAELEAILAKESANVIRRIRNEYEAARTREQLAQENYDRHASIVSAEAGRAVQYGSLKHEVETNRALYESMLQKVRESTITPAVHASSVRVISAAHPPMRPYRPRPVVDAAIAFCIGLFGATAFVFLRDRMDSTFRVPGEAPRFLKVAELGAIPSSSVDCRLMLHSAPGDSRVVREQRRQHHRLIAHAHDDSDLAEAFRSTLASLWFVGKNGKRMRVFVVASAGEREGKSTTVSNLGIALANTNRRVLLIDGDIRRPRLHELFDLGNAWGIANVLEDTRDVADYAFEDLFTETDIPGLYVLPGGCGSANIAGMRYHDRLTDLLLRIRLEFHAVLIDTPPALDFADARILGGLSDGVIFVMRAAGTLRAEAARVLKQFQEDGTPVLGSVLNEFDRKDPRYRRGYAGTYRSYGAESSALVRHG